MTQRAGTSLEFAFVCSLSDGLHARPASHLAEVANDFASECFLTNLRTGSVANLKSVLAIISTDVRQGDRCTVQVRGAMNRRRTLRCFVLSSRFFPAVMSRWRESV